MFAAMFMIIAATAGWSARTSGKSREEAEQSPGTINNGSSSVTISGVTYTKAESGVILTATQTSGNKLTPDNSNPFTVNPGSGKSVGDESHNHRLGDGRFVG